MSNNESNKDQPGGKEPDKYTGVVDFDFELTPSVFICGAAGGVLGLVLAIWATSEIGIIVATTVVFAVLSGIFGLFVPWYGTKSR
jgi:hypothetical protein